MNYKLDQKKFDDIYFEGKPMYDKVNGGTFNVVYLREYIDPECESETFAAYETIYRNVPNKYLEKFNNEIKTYFRSEVVTNLSPSTSHRSRCEFSYYDNHYAMHGPNKKLLLKSFPSAASCIKKVMPRLIKEINNS